MDENRFTQILQTLSSPDNDARKAAEAELDQAKTTNGSWVLQALCHIVSHEAPAEVHAVSLTILRKMFSKDAKFFDNEPESVRESIKQSLIAAFTSLAMGSSMSLVSACVAACAAKIYFLEGTWNELWGNLFHTIQDANANPSIRAASCEVLASCAGVLSPYLRNHHSELAAGLISCVQSSSSELKKSSVYALTELINTIPAKQMAAFVAIPEHILKSVEVSLNSNDTETAIVLLSNVCELIEGSPALFKTTAEPFLMACMQIASTPAVDAGVRHVAVEVLVVMCTHNTKVVKKVSGFANSFFDLLFSYTLNPPVDEKWDVTDDSADAAETEGNSDFDIGVTAMDRVCCGLGADVLAAHAQSLVASNLANPSWNYRQAAINVLTYSIEGLKAAFVAHLEAAIDMVLSLAKDENKVVRYSVYQCLSQMASDFAPDFQMKYHAKVMPAILAGLTDPIPRISAMAASAANSFFDDAEDGNDDDSHSANVLAPYINSTCESLANMITNTPLTFVRSTALAAMSSVIATGKHSLIPLVHHLVPIFQQIIGAPEDVADLQNSRMLKCRAIECTTLLAGVAKMEHFSAYAASVCDFLCSLLSQNMTTDDPRLPYVLRGWTNMVDCMESAILPYLPAMMPSLLNLANLDCDMELIDHNVGDEVDAEEEEEGVEKMLMVIPGKGEVVVKTKTSLIEDKITAMQIVSEIIRALKSDLGGFLPQMAQVGIKALEFCASTDVRQLGAEILDRLVECYKVAPSEVPAFVDSSVTALTTAVRTELEFSNIPNYLDAIATFAKTFPENFSADILTLIAKIFSAVCVEAGKRKAKNEKERKGQIESDDEEELDAAIETDEELMSDINQACDQLLKSIPAFTPLFAEHILPMAGNMLSHDDMNALIGMGFIAGYCEFGHNYAAAQSLDSIVPPFMHYITSTTPDVAHSAFNGLRAITLLTAGAFGTSNANAVDFANTVITKVGAFLSSPQSRTPTFGGALTNAVSCGLAVLEHFTATVDPATQTAFMNEVVGALPLSDADEVEAMSVHKRILNFFEHPVVAANPSLKTTIVQKLKSASPDTLDDATVELLKTL